MTRTIAEMRTLASAQVGPMGKVHIEADRSAPTGLIYRISCTNCYVKPEIHWSTTWGKPALYGRSKRRGRNGHPPADAFRIWEDHLAVHHRDYLVASQHAWVNGAG